MDLHNIIRQMQRDINDLRQRLATRPTVPGRGAGVPDTVSRFRQAAHGLAVGNVVRHDGTEWVKSQADTAANAVVGGVVVVKISDDEFVLATSGYVAGLSGLTAGSVHYLDATTAGALTTTAPGIAVPIIHADTTTSGIVQSLWPNGSWEGPLIPLESSRTRLTSSVVKTVDTAGWYWLVLTAGGGGGGYGCGTSTPDNYWWCGGGGGATGRRVYIGPIYLTAGQKIDYTHGGGGGAGGSIGSNGSAGGNATVELFENDGTTPIADAVVAHGGGGGGAADLSNTATDKSIKVGYGGYPGPTTSAAVHFPYPSFAAPGRDGNVQYMLGADAPPIATGGVGGMLEWPANATNDCGGGGSGGDYNAPGTAGAAGALDIVSTASFTLS